MPEMTKSARLEAFIGGPPRTVAAVVWLGALATFGLGVEPVIAAQLGGQLRLPVHATGVLLAAELGGSMLAIVPALLWGRAQWATRTAAALALGVYVLANAASALLVDAYGLLLLSRACAGLAGGWLLILALAVAARCTTPERVYGVWVIGQTVASALGLYGLPRLFASQGIAGAYLLLMVAGLLSLAVVRDLGGNQLSQLDRPVAVLSIPTRLIPALGPLFLFYASVSGIWAFAADRGFALGVASSRVSSALAFANLAGIGGAALAVAIGPSRTRARAALAGHVAAALAIVLFAANAGLTSYVAAVCLLQIAWCFTAPFLLAMCAAAGRAELMMSATNVTLGAGLTAGPLMAGWLLESPGAFTAVAAGSSILLLAAAMLLLFQNSIEPAVARGDGGTDQGTAAS